jgi:hypothetical protein
MRRGGVRAVPPAHHWQLRLSVGALPGCVTQARLRVCAGAIDLPHRTLHSLLGTERSHAHPCVPTRSRALPRHTPTTRLLLAHGVGERVKSGLRRARDAETVGWVR